MNSASTSSANDPGEARHFSIIEKLRTGHVKRWQIVRVAREQTIAEHMYRVTMVARAIAEAIGVREPNLYGLITEWALQHDLPEVITGDLATPVKAAMREAVPHDDPIRRIELALDYTYNMLYTHLKEHEKIVLDIVKIADLAEAVNFLNTEAVGQHAIDVKGGLLAAVGTRIDVCAEQYPDFDFKGEAMRVLMNDVLYS